VTSFTADDGVIEMLASTYFLFASGLFGAPVPVARVRLTVPTAKVALAWMSTLPAVGLLICTEHWPAPPLTVQLEPATKVAPAVLLSRLKLTTVPSGAGPKPLALSPPGAPIARPSSCWTVAVIVCGEPTAFVAVKGESAIFASTNRFVAGPLPPAPLFPEVERLTVTPSIVTWALTFAVNTPAELLLIVSVQVAVFPLTTGVPQSVPCVPGAGLTVVVIAPKLTGVAPDGIAVTVIVNVCE